MNYGLFDENGKYYVEESELRANEMKLIDVKKNA